MSDNRCAGCGRFHPWENLMSMAGDGSESWFECVNCMSAADLHAFKTARLDRETRKETQARPSQGPEGSAE